MPEALAFLFASVEALPTSAALAAIEAEVSRLKGIAGDADIAWAISLVTAAVGHPASREPADLDEVRARVEDVLVLARVKDRIFVRIGDSTWTKYRAGAVDPPDRVALQPENETARSFSPLIKHLASVDAADFEACGFVPLDLAHQGQHALSNPDTKAASA